MKKSYPAAGGRDRAACAWFRCLLIVPMLLFGLSGTEAAAQTQPLRFPDDGVFDLPEYFLL